MKNKQIRRIVVPSVATNLILKRSKVKVTAWCQLKWIVTRIMHAEYQCSTINTLKDMSQVKVFVTDRRTDGQRDGQTDEWDLMSPAFAKARGKKGGGALMHVYVWEHIVSLYYRTALLMFTKLGRDEVLTVPYKCCCFSARFVQGRIQGGQKKVTGGPLLQRTSSSDWKATATNRMHSNDLEACGV